MYSTHLSEFKKTVLYVLVALVCIAIPLPSVYADNINPSLFSIDSSPYGTSNNDWSIKWWKWFMEIPQDQNPATDKTGKLCSTSQNDPNVWFIIGVLEGRAERTCKIPNGKAVFFAHGIECSKIENKLNTDDELKKCAVEGLPKLVGTLEASIDGVPLKNLTHYRVTSKPYDVYFPPNNVWGVPAGTTRSVADTYIIFLKPLSEGNHVFEFKASSPANPLVGPTSRHALEVKYNLIVGK
jgi:hypothetical protein